MNFLNDSFKTLKNVLAEGLEEKVDFEGSSLDVVEADARDKDYADNENLRILCQHQSEEVKPQYFCYCAVSTLLLVSCCTFYFLFVILLQRN